MKKIILLVITFYISLTFYGQNKIESNNDIEQKIIVDWGIWYSVNNYSGCYDAYWLCRVSTKKAKEDSDISHVCFNNNGRISMKINLNLLSQKEKEKFSGSDFLMENDYGVEEFEIPEEIVTSLSLTTNTIKKGRYPILNTDNENILLINF